MKLKICTYNLRYDNDYDGINRFALRREYIARVFPGYEPDVVGFQEVLPHMRDWLEARLSGYTIAGTGREGDFSGECNPIAFRSDRFLLMALDTFWLSDTPNVPGSRFSTDQSICPRICTAAVLLERGTTRRLRVYNTHLDHEGEQARRQGIRLILQRIAADDARYPGVPVVLMGDFNAEPDSEVVKLLSHTDLRDTTGEIPGTFHSYHPERPMSKIDYIYTNAPWDAGTTRALTSSEAGVYLSDHYPVMAEISL